MARVRMFGTEFEAERLYELPDGWMMRSRGHSGRTSPGTVFFAKHYEIVAEGPKVDLKGTNVEAEMAAEREKLPTFAEIDAKNGNAEKRQSRLKAYQQAIKEYFVGGE